ncbi:MAG TPA: tripartite tricarboxylate transporter substrate-binding protein [Xanthobacteraceae bacterium]|nr:tripartite tricarboxylate transporter substrate-binding protein [Xanthobacteraceae bacterium]
MIDRRAFARGAALAPLAIARARGEPAWPDRVIRIIVPFAAGAFTDVSARLLVTELAEELGQSVIVENRGGAGSVLGTTAVVRAAPDGYTLLLTDTSLSISPGLYPDLAYDPLRDLAQISRVALSPSILLVRPDLGVRTLAELVALGRQRPGEVSFGSGGPGSSAHLAMELMLDVAGIRGQHVPFRGVAAAITEIMAGRVDMVIASLAAGVAQVKAGTLLGLALSADQRSPLLPQVPTFAEAGLPAYRMMFWWGLAAPAGTPGGIVERLNYAVNVACAKPRLRAAFAQQAAIAAPSTPGEMRALLEREIELWKRVIVRAKVTVQ